jgi:hypothetical protein
MPHASRFLRCLALAVAVALSPAARSQESDGAPLRLRGFEAAGLRRTVTESWGTFRFIVANPAAADRDARVLVFYPERPDVQFGRDVWVPAGASLSAWVPVGPAPRQASSMDRTLEVLLYDRTAGADRLLLPSTEERARSRMARYQPREPTTALILDEDAFRLGDPGSLTQPGSPAAQALTLVQAFRNAGNLSEQISVVPAEFLPPTPAAFDLIDHVVIAGGRLAADPPGLAALRHWVQQGGYLWVMLDLVDPAVVATILGDAFDLPIVDRVGLTTVRLHRGGGDPEAAAAQEFERPVDLVRVLPTEADRVVHTVNGWPASFTRQVGRGKVLFTALGARAWHRPRDGADPASPFTTVPDLPVPLLPLVELAAEFRPQAAPHPFTAEALRTLLYEEIGYSVIGRGAVAAVLGAFLLVLLALALGVRQMRRPELTGWLAPAAAVAAAGLFVVLGQGSRRAVPPTAAVAEVVDAVPGSGEAAVNGLFAVYHPASGLAPVGTDRGADLDLDVTGLEGQIRRRVQTDADAWHLENLSLPAGVRSGLFRSTARTGRVSAVARFGSGGVEGRLTASAFRDSADALIVTPAREPVAARVGAGGAFTADTSDMLAAGQFLAGTVLTDRRQRRQTVYRQLLTGALPEHLAGRDLFLTWAEPAEIPFSDAEATRTVATALLIVPLEFERPAAGTRVTVPPTFVPYRRATEGGFAQPTMEANLPADMRLRFQLPASVVPMTVERATLVARVRTPGWRFAVAGYADGKPVPLHAEDSPAEPVRVEIADPRLLRLDEQGGLHLNVKVGLAGMQSSDARWKIESLSLEVVGRTE